MRVVLTQGVRRGDPDVYQIVPQVFANKRAARRYVEDQKIRAGRITYLTRQVKA